MSTSIWGDVVEQSFGDLVDVEVVIPDNADPHHFSPSVRQAGELENADLVVVNGAGLEAGLDPAVAAAEKAGVPVFRVVDHVPTRTVGEGDGMEDGMVDDVTDEEPSEDEHGDDEHGDDEHGDDEHDDDEHDDDEHGDDEHGHDGVDPHVWFDASLVSDAVTALGQQLDETLVNGATVASADYQSELEALDAAIESRIETIPADQRKLITNHDSLGYYADRYGLEVVATMVGSLTTDAEPSTAEVAEVASVVDESGVKAVFVEASGSDKLAKAVVAESGREVAVVALRTEGLGDDGSYVDMMNDDTDDIVTGLTGKADR